MTYADVVDMAVAVGIIVGLILLADVIQRVSDKFTRRSRVEPRYRTW